MEQFLLWVLIGLICLQYLAGTVLEYLNRSQWRDHLPQSLRDFYDEQEYRRAAAYHDAHFRLSTRSGILNTALLLLMLGLGLFGWLDQYLRIIMEHPVWLALVYFGILGLASDLVNMPFSLYNTFVIEEKFGFNKTNLKTYFTDKVKGLLLSVIIGGTIAGLLLWLMIMIGPTFWIYGLIVLVTFSLVMNYFATTLILPLFNKLKPLEKGELRNAIEEMAQQADFPVFNIYVIDGSRRSSKANASFSGFGKNKKIILYDTLIENHTKEELVAVLAHEIGHYKKGHIHWNMAISVIQTAVMLYLLSLFVYSETLSYAMGAQQLSYHLNLIAFGILYGPLSTVFGVASNVLSRRHEFEADAFAVRATGDSKALQEALKKLSVNHLANLHPHPAYVFMNYSHPPLLQRLDAMDKAAA